MSAPKFTPSQSAILGEDVQRAIDEMAEAEKEALAKGTAGNFAQHVMRFRAVIYTCAREHAHANMRPLHFTAASFRGCLRRC